MLWMIPSTYGDIRVLSTGPTTCKVLVEQATPEEQAALNQLLKTATKKKWLPPESTSFGTVTLLEAPIEKVSKELARALKPKKKLVSAVKFANGKMEEVTETTFATLKTSPSASSVSSTTPKDTSKPVVATTVAAPVRGCPPPDFSPARLRAREVLTAFLTQEQRADFEKFNRFIATGATTGHRYMITSRHAKDQLAQYERTLYDLDDRTPLCVHDFDVPPEEEMHAIHVLTQLPGWERFLRTLPE
ncbi:hypothetical protein Rctr197k_110 [Virus Rctr197k]|nr:hypothetical protein Rctr197k_110 [Virus Rctr197k]